jgi:hypothetical protein
MKPVDLSSGDATAVVRPAAPSHLADLVRDVEALMQKPETVEIGQLAKLIERLNGEFSMLHGHAGLAALGVPDNGARAASTANDPSEPETYGGAILSNRTGAR